ADWFRDRDSRLRAVPPTRTLDLAGHPGHRPRRGAPRPRILAPARTTFPVGRVAGAHRRDVRLPRPRALSIAEDASCLIDRTRPAAARHAHLGGARRRARRIRGLDPDPAA